MQDEEPLSIKDIAFLQLAAEFLGVSRQTIHTWRKEGILPEYRFGPTKRVCFKWADLEAIKAERLARLTTNGEYDE